MARWEFLNRALHFTSLFLAPVWLRITVHSLMHNHRPLPARYHPKVSRLEGGRDDNHKEKRLSRKLVRSIKRWAASVRTARLPAMYPPAKCIIAHRVEGPECNSTHIHIKHCWLTQLEKKKKVIQIKLIHFFFPIWKITVTLKVNKIEHVKMNVRPFLRLWKHRDRNYEANRDSISIRLGRKPQK